MIYHLLSEDDRMLTDNKERAELFNSVLVQFSTKKYVSQEIVKNNMK